MNKKLLTEYYKQLISEEHAKIPMNFEEFIHQERLLAEETREKPALKDSLEENQERRNQQTEPSANTKEQLMTQEQMIRDQRRKTYVVISEEGKKSAEELRKQQARQQIMGWMMGREQKADEHFELKNKNLLEQNYKKYLQEHQSFGTGQSISYEDFVKKERVKFDREKKKKSVSVPSGEEEMEVDEALSKMEKRKISRDHYKQYEEYQDETFEQRNKILPSNEWKKHLLEEELALRQQQRELSAF